MKDNKLQMFAHIRTEKNILGLFEFTIPQLKALWRKLGTSNTKCNIRIKKLTESLSKSRVLTITDKMLRKKWHSF